ncbi:Putative beta-lactamase HcpD [bacterium HR19]|nr:Putative beta-lactamase HcpD [bacterium HR19]
MVSELLFSFFIILLSPSRADDECFSGSITACESSAVSYEKNKDYSKAVQFYDSACSLGSWKSCIKLYAVYMKDMWGMGRNLQVSFGYAKKAIDIIGNSRAEDFYKEGCSLGVASDCFHLSGLYEERYKNSAEAKKLLEKAVDLAKRGCHANDPADCFILGFMYKVGRGVEKNENKAKELFEKSCKLGGGGGCYEIAYEYKDRDKKKYLEYLRLACEGVRPDACYELWRELKDKKFLLKACTMGLDYACREL